MEEKTEEKARSKRIVEMLRNSRRTQNVNLEQLAEGVCTRSMLQKVEYGERTVNRNSLNRLLARLGVDQKKYEKYLYYTEYDEWKLKNDIINAIEDGKLELAESLIDDYDKDYFSIGNIEQQFSIFMRAQILQHKNSSEYDDELYNLYQQAMLLTVPNAYERETSSLMLSTDELNLILECRNREMYTNDAFEIFDIYRGFIKYIDNTRFDIGARAKIYPKVVVCMYNQVKKYVESMEVSALYKMYRRIAKYCEQSVDILFDDCKSYYMYELFMAYIEILETLMKVSDDENERRDFSERCTQLKKWSDTYKEVCEEYEIPYLMLDSCYLYREEEVYCINDVIYKRRKMLGITMTKLSEGVCSERTIRRLERRECKALEGIVDELFWKLGMSDEYANMGIVTNNKEDVELYEQSRRAINAKEYGKAEQIIELLEQRLDDCQLNKQAILEIKCLIDLHRGMMSEEEHIRALEEIVSCTLDMSKLHKKNVDICLSKREMTCINSMAKALKRNKQYEKALDMVGVLKKYCDSLEENGFEDTFFGLYEVIMCFYASLIGSMGQYERSTSISDKLNKLSLKLKRTNMLHYNMYNIFWNACEMDKNIEPNKELEKCVRLCQLTRNKFFEDCYIQKMK